MIQQEKQESYLGPFITLVFLFLIVGFLTTVNGQLQAPLKSVFLHQAGNLKNTFATLITFSWFLAYPLTGGIGAAWVNKYGYKGTLLRALLLMILGMGIFFLSSWFTVQFPDSGIQVASAIIPLGYLIFLMGSFIVGASATILQVVINPYLSASYVRGTQPVQRLAVGGASNAIGTTIAPFFVTGIVFGGVAMENVLVHQLMLPFLVLMGVISIVVVVLLKLSLPDIVGTKSEAGEKLEKSVWSFRHLTLGVIAIFFYVGAEVCIGNNINLYVVELQNSDRVFSVFGNRAFTLFGIDFAIPAFMATLYWGGILLGRLVGSSLRKVSPKVQLITTSTSATILVILAIIMDSPWMLVAVGLFHSIMWGAIYTLAVAKLGKYISVASGIFMIGVVGGAILPLLQGILADSVHGWRWTWFIVLFGELFILFYALTGSKVKQLVK